MMITISTAAYLVGGASLFGAFVGHVFGFGLRTRKVRLHDAPRSLRERHDRAWVGLTERHPQGVTPPLGTPQGPVEAP